jgi:hypothetical protein
MYDSSSEHFRGELFFKLEKAAAASSAVDIIFQLSKVKFKFGDTKQ